jgi:hypothetical protein
MYAEGFSQTAKDFNCIQRSHQQGEPHCLVHFFKSFSFFFFFFFLACVALLIHLCVSSSALETFPSFVALSLVGGLRFPILTAAGGLLWCVARLKWAEG